MFSKFLHQPLPTVVSSSLKSRIFFNELLMTSLCSFLLITAILMQVTVTIKPTAFKYGVPEPSAPKSSCWLYMSVLLTSVWTQTYLQPLSLLSTPSDLFFLNVLKRVQLWYLYAWSPTAGVKIKHQLFCFNPTFNKNKPYEHRLSAQ